MIEKEIKQYLIDLTKMRKRFFALGQELGYSSGALKNRAKVAYDEEDTFSNLTIAELTALITKLEQKYEEKIGKIEFNK